MTDLIVRFDPTKNRSVAFVADSIDKGQLLTWNGKGEAQVVGVDYYRATSPVSKDVAKQVAKQYAKAHSENSVVIRERLPRMYMNEGGKYKTAPKANVVQIGAVPPATAAPKPVRMAKAVHTGQRKVTRGDVDALAKKLALLLAPIMQGKE